MTPAARAALARIALVAGQQVRDERLRRGWALRDLADRAGVAAATAQAAEWGVVASLESYARLATALGLRPSLDLADTRDRDRATGRGPRGTHTRDRAGDFVHAAMGEIEARALAGPGRTVAIDEPYQHYQFAGRADLLTWDLENLLHIENGPSSRTSRRPPARTTPSAGTWRGPWRSAWISAPAAGVA